jgi:hypothetical protein
VSQHRQELVLALVGELLALEGLPQGHLELVPAAHLALQRVRPLLEPGDLVHSAPGLLRLAVGLGGRHPGVRRADAPEPLPVALLDEAVHRVTAQQPGHPGVHDVVPRLLERERGAVVTVPPEQIDHLAIGTHATSTSRGGRQEPAAGGREQLRVGHSVDHELGQRLGGVDEDELARADGATSVVPARDEATLDRLPVRLGRDEDDRLAAAEPGGGEVGDDVAQELVVLVELNDVGRVVSLARHLELPCVAHRSPGKPAL